MISIVRDNRIYTDGLQTCEFFNKYFSSVSTKIHESFPSPSSEDDFSYYLRNIQISTTFSFSMIQITEVENTILSLKEKKLISLRIPTES